MASIQPRTSHLIFIILAAQGFNFHRAVVSKVLCVNNCNGNQSGVCQDDGTCKCNEGYFGDDCSVVFFEALAGRLLFAAFLTLQL